MPEQLDLSPWHEWPELYNELERRRAADARWEKQKRPDREAGAHDTQEEVQDDRVSYA